MIDHKTDGTECWCHPRVIKTDGADVIVHNYQEGGTEKMITTVRITMDIPIEHHSDASEKYITTAVQEAVHNNKVSVLSSRDVESYKVLADTNRHTEILRNE